MNPHVSRRKPLIAAVMVTAAILPMGIGCNTRPNAEAASTSPSAAPITPLASAPAPASQPEPPDPKSFTTTGPLVAEQQADVAAERTGRVVDLPIQIGDRVKRGQVLALLDDRVLRSTAEAQKARVTSAQASVREWEAEELSARASLRRADSMRENKIMTMEDWERAKYRVDETVAAVARFHSEEAVAQADLNTANLQLEQSRIVAPFDGVVGRSSVRVAQEVKAGDVLFWITAEAPLRVLFTVPESVMAAFSTGRLLDLTTAAYPGLHQPARIVRVSPVVDPASGSVQVIGAVENRLPQLKPGMSMQVRLAP
jgi:RND family efflux transporter MFP subunit